VGRKRTRSPDWLPKRCYVHRQQVVYYPPGLVDGKPKKPIALGQKDNPSAVLAEYGKLVKTSGTPPRTLGEGIDRYLTEIVPTLGDGSHETYRLYCGKLKKGLGNMLPDEVEITDLYAYHEAREAPVRANREITVLGRIYQHLIKWRSATKNPTLGFLYTREKDRDREVTGSERRRFASSCCPDWIRGYMTLKHLVGRRQGEMLKLTKFSGGRDGIAFKILKKRRERTLVIQWTPRLRRVWGWLLELERPDTCAWIFWSTKGKTRGDALSKRGFKSAWQRAQAKWIAAGNVAFWEHDLRAATGAASKTDEDARALLDHEDVRTTRKSYRRARVQKVSPLR
jgi:hypothetical protein